MTKKKEASKTEAGELSERLARVEKLLAESAKTIRNIEKAVERLASRQDAKAPRFGNLGLGDLLSEEMRDLTGGTKKKRGAKSRRTTTPSGPAKKIGGTLRKCPTCKTGETLADETTEHAFVARCTACGWRYEW